MACGSDLAPSLSPDGVLTARITGEVSHDYSGSGTFYVGVFEDGRPQFSFHSSTKTLGNFSVGETIVFQGVFEGVPEPGIYPVVPYNHAAPLDRPVGGFIGGYSWRDSDVQPGDVVSESYMAQDGHVEILASTAERVEGRFTVRGARTCREVKLSVGQESCDWAPPGPDSPLVTITGSFVLVLMWEED